MKVTNATKDINLDMLYADGTRRRVLITSGTINLLRRAAVIMPWLFEGTGFNPLAADVSNIVAITRPDHDILHQVDGARRQAIFRLGQMDMRESVAAKLRNAAANVYGIARATLESAADLIDEMETMA